MSRGEGKEQVLLGSFQDASAVEGEADVPRRDEHRPQQAHHQNSGPALRPARNVYLPAISPLGRGLCSGVRSSTALSAPVPSTFKTTPPHAPIPLNVLRLQRVQEVRAVINGGSRGGRVASDEQQQLQQNTLYCGILDHTHITARPLQAENPSRRIALVWRKASPRERDFRLLAEVLAQSAPPRA